MADAFLRRVMAQRDAEQLEARMKLKRANAPIKDTRELCVECFIRRTAATSGVCSTCTRHKRPPSPRTLCTRCNIRRTIAAGGICSTCLHRMRVAREEAAAVVSPKTLDGKTLTRDAELAEIARFVQQQREAATGVSCQDD